MGKKTKGQSGAVIKFKDKIKNNDKKNNDLVVKLKDPTKDPRFYGTKIPHTKPPQYYITAFRESHKRQTPIIRFI